MNLDVLKGKWKQAKGQMKTEWGKLTEDDLKKVEGKNEELSGRLQERYGYGKEEADKKINEFLDKL